jgi:hypothetical protein
MTLVRKFARWLWAEGDAASARARERRLPVWEYPWFNRLYRTAMILGWVAVLAFFLIWNLVWSTP